MRAAPNHAASTEAHITDMENSPSLVLIVVATFVAAGFVKGVTGMGLPTVAMGILGGVLSPVLAASLLIAPTLVTNVWQFASGTGKRAIIARLWPMTAATFLGTFGGSFFLTSGNSRATTSALGTVLVGYAVYMLLARPISVPARWQSVLSPTVGLLTGLIGGATGISVVPVAPYLQALGMDRDDLIQALGLSFTASTVALGLALAFHGAFPAANLLTSAFAIVPALAGMWLGQRLLKRVSPRLFRRMFLVCLLLLGGEMLVRPLL